ncbi:four helix bundle protein [soil metagenome]|nr:four helix bundle protein [Gemmatimonadota bacterium]
MGDYRSLRVWEKAHSLALAVYQATKGFPASEMYGLTSQMRRAAVSIPSNIAEGCGRNTQKELARFCRIALGSTNEPEYQALLAYELKLLDAPQFQRLTTEIVQVKKMLANFIVTLLSDNR